MTEEEQKNPHSKMKLETNWTSVLFLLYFHMCAMFGLFLVITAASIKTTIFCFALIMFGVLGVTTGCHRLWAHKTYRAVWPLRLFLICCHTLVCQGSVYDWVLDHRIHHKFHGTEKDFYNFKRGFSFSQIGCRCVNGNVDYKQVANEVDMSDIEQDKLVMFQKNFYWVIMPVVSILLPINLPVAYWDESILASVFVVGFLRVIVLLQCAWLINSATIVWGLDPLDKKSADTNLVFIVTKSLWPQYHYLLPWDYKSGEFGTYGTGCSTAFIRVWAATGLASGLRTIDTDGVKAALSRAVNTGSPVLHCLNEAHSLCADEDVLDHSKHR
uniref:Desaturase 2 n=1 Tax=Nilaparvata lugens TaxID=108931 RepID=A0A4D6C9E2_NILLU|nr:desaturase 2 [Nilaparvata lugens]